MSQGSKGKSHCLLFPAIFCVRAGVCVCLSLFTGQWFTFMALHRWDQKGNQSIFNDDTGFCYWQHQHQLRLTWKKVRSQNVHSLFGKVIIVSLVWIFFRQWIYVIVVLFALPFGREKVFSRQGKVNKNNLI